MLRRDVLKGVFGGAAAVALGEMGFSREAEAASVKTCQNARGFCRFGCSTRCAKECDAPHLANCPFCNVCTVVPVDPCAEEDLACPAGGGCNLNCLRACGRTGDNTCASCAVCAPPA